MHKILEDGPIFTINAFNIQSNELYTDYQPLYRLDDYTLFSFESLLRSKASIPPNELFELSRLEAKVNTLDKLSIERGINTYSDFASSNESLLFLNVLPSTLLQDDFFEFLDAILEQTEMTKKRIVFELSETISEAKNWEVPALKKAISRLRKQDIQIAIDDVGSGIACNQKIIEFEPDFIKIDKYFGIGLSSSKLKQLTVQSYSFLCRGNSTLILEGIETKEDLELAKELGVTVGQGYFLGKPGPLTDFEPYYND